MYLIIHLHILDLYKPQLLSPTETLIIFQPTIMEKINGQTPKNGVVFDTTSNVQPI